MIVRDNSTPPRILFVINKKVPEGDYRLIYSKRSKSASVCFALPAKPDSVAPADFVSMKIQEGLTANNLLELVRFAVMLRRRRRQFAAIHFFSTLLMLLGPQVAHFLGIRSLFTVTGLGRTFDEDRPGRRALRALYRGLMRRSIHVAERVLFQNKGHQAMFGEWFPEYRKKFQLVGSATHAPVRLPRLKREGNVVVLTVARIMPAKGIEDFLAVAKQLAGHGFLFDLVGPPSVGCETLQAEVEVHHEQGVIRHYGERIGQELYDRYLAADIFYFPSQGEGMSRAMLEAGFQGLCPVAYDIPANRDLIDEGRGFLVPVNDVPAVTARLVALGRDRAELRQVASAYQEFILRNYSTESYSKKLDAIFREIFGCS